MTASAKPRKPHAEKPDPSSLRCRLNEAFRKFSSYASYAAGSKWAFGIAILSVVIWLGFGPSSHYSDTWQLIINTSTTIVTFLMVFLIQNTQNRDSRAIHLKLDELVRSISAARNKLVNVEDMSDEDLDDLKKDFERVRSEADRRSRGEQTRKDAAEARTEAHEARATAEDAKDVAEDARDVAEDARSEAAIARSQSGRAAK